MSKDMKTTNGDMPAMPQPFAMTETECGTPETHLLDHEIMNGMTKREMFAMSAPDIPDWFTSNFAVENDDKKDLVRLRNTNAGAPSSIKPEFSLELTHYGKEACYFAWRAYYADALLKELEK